MEKKFIRVICPAPVLNIEDFDSVFNKSGKLKTCDRGHIRNLEFIALKNMIFEIIFENQNILKIKSTFYKGDNLYIDKRFTKEIKKFKFFKPKPILNKKRIISYFISAMGSKYIWGGNFYKGINKILKFYPSQNISNQNSRILKGVDCSGLLYEATNGYTPRNTSELINFGQIIKVENKNIDEIIKTLNPLDLVIYKGHVIIIFDKKYTIESREKFGVVKTKIKKRLLEISKEKRFTDNFYNEKSIVIRRWI